MHKPTSEQLATFRSLFVAWPDAYALWQDGKPTAIRKPLDADVIGDHLAGDERVGTYLIRPDGRVSFMVLDVDERNRGLARTIVKRLQKRRMRAYVERSKSKGFHVWVFFAEPTPADLARKFAQALLGDLLTRKIEVFPKQDKVTEGGLGNCIWLPLFPPDVAKGKTAFVDASFHPYSNQWKFLATVRRVPSNRFSAALEKLAAPKTRPTTGMVKPATTALPPPISRFPRILPPTILRFPRTQFFPRLPYHASELPVCAHAILWHGVEEGHRNEALFSLAKHLRNSGLSQVRVEELVFAANQQCRPPLPEAEAESVVKSVFIKGYTSLGCDNTFIASLCGNCCPVKYPKRGGSDKTAIGLLDHAESYPSIHPSQAYEQGKLWYGLKMGKACIWVNIDRRAVSVEGMKTMFRLDKMPTNLKWSVPSIKDFLNGNKYVDSYELYTKLVTLLSDHIRFRARWQSKVIALWTMGTYLYRMFDYYAYLWLTSPGRRAGKSKLLEILSALAYNATDVLTNPSEAALFRDTAVSAGTQVLDEVESLRHKDQEKQAGLMSVINCGFKAGSTVPRFNMNTGAVEYLDVYCPRALAGINRLDPVLVDRCIKIFLRRKSVHEKVSRFGARKQKAELQQLRDELHVFALQCANAIADHYERIDSIELPEELDDRARDILEPLFAIARVIDDANPEAYLTNQLILASESIAKDRLGDEGEDEEIAAALEVLMGSFPEDEDRWVLTSRNAVTILQKHDSLEWVEKPHQARTLLRRLGFRSSTHRVGKQVVRGYKIRRHTLREMSKSYGVAA